MKKYFFVLMILVGGYAAGAQTFAAEATLPKPDSTGFHRIFISPEAGVYLNETFSDLRLYDATHHEVPYIAEQEVRSQVIQQFRPYAILENNQKPGCCTSLVLHNPERRITHTISLAIKNAAVTKTATLQGSDDRKNWFALKAQFVLDAWGNPTATSEVKIVDFPLSNYTYYQLTINDSTSAPLNILRAGYYEGLSKAGSYAPLPDFSISTADSVKEKKTFVHFTWPAAYSMDKLVIDVGGAPYFFRNAILYKKTQRQTKKGVSTPYYENVRNFQLASAEAGIVDLEGIKAKDFLLVIENADNPPLKILSLQGYQLKHHIVAWLQKDSTYLVKLGGRGLTHPSYDLTFFKDSIASDVPLLKLSGIQPIQEAIEPDGNNEIFTTQSIIWFAIVIVIAFLGYMSVRLLREAGAKEG